MSKEDFLTFPSPLGRSSRLPADLCILLTDTLESPSLFLLTHFLSRALRDGRRALVVGLGNSFDGYSAVLKKAGIQLASEKNQKVFTFVEGRVEQSLEELYRRVEAALGEEALVIIDDISSLLWGGHSVVDLKRFFAGVRALVYASKGSLVVLQHGDSLVANGTSPDDALFDYLLRQSDLWLQTSSLSSQTRGELSIHLGPALVDDLGMAERSGPTALLYKLEESGAVFSAKGLGKGGFF